MRWRRWTAWVLVALAGSALSAGVGAAPRRGDEGAEEDVQKVAEHARRVALLERIERRYQRYKTVKGRFEQVVHLRDQDRKRVQKGDLLFKRPGRLRFSFDGGGWVASDGKWLRAYDPEAKTVYVMKAERSLYPPVLSFLEGEDTLKKSFAWRLVEVPEDEHEAGTVALVGRPNKPTPAVVQVVLLVDEHTGRLRRVMVVDAEGNTNRFTFEKMRAGMRIPNKAFRPRKPRGARVVKP